MRWGVVRRAFRAPQFNLSRPFRLVAIAALALAAAGCASEPAFRLASLGPVPAGVTIAFDSIDGPPPEVFRKLVANLNDEAQTRRIAVVSRSAAATYRVRGYVSALVERDKTSFGWVWDIYNSDKSRVQRINGEELASSGRGRDAWAAADDRVLRRMASSGMDRIAVFLNSDQPLPAAPAVETPGITLAAARDDSPEAAGIFRLFGAKETTGAAPAADPAADVSTLPQRAKPARQQVSRAAVR